MADDYMDDYMKEVVDKLKDSKRRSEDARKEHDRTEEIKQKEGIRLWNALLEWIEKCCALHELAEALKFKKPNDHQFTVLLDENSNNVTLQVTFDAGECTISYVVNSTRVFRSPAAKTNGRYYPRVVGDKLLFSDGHAGDNVSIREVGKALLLLLWE
jgi:hypothetical protein